MKAGKEKMRKTTVSDSSKKHGLTLVPPFKNDENIIVRDLEEIALCCSECDCDDCLVSTHDNCKTEMRKINKSDDDLSEVCLSHWMNWLTGKQDERR